MDIVYLGLVALFLALMAGVVVACDKLGAKS
jgi:hypothetical protein